MHGLAAAVAVTLSVLLAASLAAGTRAPPLTQPHPPTHTHSCAGKLFSLAFAKNKNSSLLEETNTLQEHKTCDHNRMAHLNTMQF